MMDKLIIFMMIDSFFYIFLLYTCKKIKRIRIYTKRSLIGLIKQWKLIHIKRTKKYDKDKDKWMYKSINFSIFLQKVSDCPEVDAMR